MKLPLTILLTILFLKAYSQSQTKRALFIGNSYTYVNNLPQAIADLALSVGDSLLFDSNTIGGYTLAQHSTNATTLSKIANGNWNFVVLQEQSQLPSFPISQVLTDVFPFARTLDSTIKIYNACAETMFYMTWGRKNGDASNCSFWPPVCSYNGMDSLLNLRYRMLADSNQSLLSPVGKVWNYIRLNYPLIDLYQSDESHPTVYGTYAAACCFYAVIFRKDPSLITNDYGLTSLDANNIRNAAKVIAFDSLLTWHIGEYDPLANFQFTQSSGRQVTFINNAINCDKYTWDFGDGDTSTNMNPIHTYNLDGNYIVTLIGNKCDKIDSTQQTISINSTGLSIKNIQQNIAEIYPNPALTSLYLKTNEASSYRMINFLGIEMKRELILSSKQKIDVSYLKSGIYILQLFSNENYVKQIKFVKN